MFLPEDIERAVLDEHMQWLIRFPSANDDRWLTRITVTGGPGNSTIFVQVEGERPLSYIQTGPDNGLDLYPGAVLIPAGCLVFVNWNRGTGPAPLGTMKTELATSRGWQELDNANH